MHVFEVRRRLCCQRRNFNVLCTNHSYWEVYTRPNSL